MILTHAEALLRENGGERLMLSDVAARMGNVPSYLHVHYRTKRDLVAALAQRWFASVECAARNADEAAKIMGGSEERLRAQVLAITTVKRAAFADDPVLFRAYLRLAGNHLDVVRKHTDCLRDIMRAPITELVQAEKVGAALELFEDATVQFRVPHMIALAPERATRDRANRVMDAVFLKLQDMAKDP